MNKSSASKNPNRSIEIIVFCFNHDRFLEQCLMSILSQQCSIPYFITVVDDGSSDSTAKVLDRIHSQNPKQVRVYRNKENKFSKNRAYFYSHIKKSPAEFIAIASGDDYWTNTAKLETQLRVLDANPNIDLVSHSLSLDLSGEIVRLPKTSLRRIRVLKESNFRLGNPIRAGSTLMRSALNFADLPDELPKDVLEDYVMWWILFNGQNFVEIREDLSAYRVHDNNLWAGKSPLKGFSQVLSTIRFIEGIDENVRFPRFLRKASLLFSQYLKFIAFSLLGLLTRLRITVRQIFND